MTVTGQKLLVGVLGLALFGSILAAGYVDVARREHARQLAASHPKLDPKLEKGRDLYMKYSCFVCHGVDGKGGNPNFNAQTGQKVPPVAFVQESYTAAELATKIRNGVSEVERADPDGPKPPLYMPAFKDLISDQDMKLLVAYLDSLMPKEEKDAW